MTTAKADIQELYSRYRASLPEAYQWEDERDRWHELAFTTLVEACGLDEETARRTIGAAGVLNLLDPAELAKAVTKDGALEVGSPLATTLTGILVTQGLEASQARDAVHMLAGAAAAVAKRHGKLQLFLRQHGVRMVADLEQTLANLRIAPDARRRLAVAWLQSALEIPVVLESEHVETFCRERGYSVADMVTAADELDVNVGVLDDLVRADLLEAVAQVEDEQA